MAKFNSYNAAGVDIKRGDDFASFIKSLPSRSVSKQIGSFAGGISIEQFKDYENPILLSTTDGVGTKLLVAKKLNKFDTIGIDLVAMSVNDLIVCGAKPLSFLDYIACGRIKEEVLKPVIEGIVKGCEIAGTTLIGGETAEMPDIYGENDFDLAGFCMGIVEEKKMLPRTDEIISGDLIYGLPSSGIHSNGLSWVRKILSDADSPVWEMLLTPTKIYVQSMDTLMNRCNLKGAAHITGGGLEGNIRRLLPNNLTIQLTWDWEIPAIFKLIQDSGGIDSAEMNKTFNMGIGIAIIIEPEEESRLIKTAKEEGIDLFRIGEVTVG